jgi:hypothetical protein
VFSVASAKTFALKKLKFESGLKKQTPFLGEILVGL